MIGLLLFATGFGLGYSFGILVTIKKDGKTTTVEAPDGSNVQVNEQGNVKIDLDDDQAKAAAGPSRQPASEGKKPGQEKHRRTPDGTIVPDTYRLGPGDILWIYRTRGGGGPGSTSRVLLGQNWIEISKTGTVYLGSKYRDVNLQGLSLDEAERAIEKKIRDHLDKYSPEVSITIADNEMKVRQLPDSYRISPGDMLSLHISNGRGGGPENTTSEIKPDDKYKGLTIKEAEENVRNDLIEFMNSTKIEITLQALRETEQHPGDSQNELPGSGEKTEGQSPSLVPSVSPAAEMKAIQGRWKVVNIEKEKGGDFSLSTSAYVQFGKPVKEYARPSNPFHATNPYSAFMHVEDFNKKQFNNFIYKVDPAAKPKTIDLYEDSLRPPGVKGELSALGIYELDGDQLRICLANYRPPTFTDPRPKDFAVKPGSENVLVTLQRFPPTADEKEIQGNWDVTRQTDDGNAILEGQATSIVSISFPPKVADIRVHNNSGKIDNASVPYAIVSDTDPKRFLSYVHNSDRYTMTYIWSGIYKFEGDRLWIAFRINGQVPEKFESPPGSGVTLLELRKNEPNKAEQAEAKPAGQNPAAEKPEMQKPQGQDENNK